jgi:hypothetical protein
LKTGRYRDEDAFADDTIIPEFVDRFADGMPILYLRARVGANSGGNSAADNPIITDLSTTNRTGQYDLSQIIAYTGAYSEAGNVCTLDSGSPPAGAALSIGVGKKISKTDYTTAPTKGFYHGLRTVTVPAPATPPYPFDAYWYFTSSSGSVRQKDGYILISAGADRVYGTQDDICSFGNVGQ